jgi:hypothetical protein
MRVRPHPIVAATGIGAAGLAAYNLWKRHQRRQLKDNAEAERERERERDRERDRERERERERREENEINETRARKMQGLRQDLTSLIGSFVPRPEAQICRWVSVEAFFATSQNEDSWMYLSSLASKNRVKWDYKGYRRWDVQRDNECLHVNQDEIRDSMATSLALLHLTAPRWITYAEQTEPRFTTRERALAWQPVDDVKRAPFFEGTRTAYGRIFTHLHDNGSQGKYIVVNMGECHFIAHVPSAPLQSPFSFQWSREVSPGETPIMNAFLAMVREGLTLTPVPRLATDPYSLRTSVDRETMKQKARATFKLEAPPPASISQGHR